MTDGTNQSGLGGPRDGAGDRVKRPYHPPRVRSFGSVRDLTLTNAEGPNFDGGGGANIYAS